MYVYIYIYIHTIFIIYTHTYVPVSEKNTPLEKNACRKTSFHISTSRAGEQFVLLDCRAAAHPK